MRLEMRIIVFSIWTVKVCFRSMENTMTHLTTLKSLIADWKRKDVEAVLSHVSEDIVYYYAVGEAPVRGAAAMRGFLERIKDHQKDTNWIIKRHAENGDMIMTEGVDEYTNPAGLRIRTPHMTVWEFTDGKISGWRDYFDFGLLKRMEGGETPSEHVESLAKV